LSMLRTLGILCVISPESCSSILWKSREYKEQAAEVFKTDSSDMKKTKNCGYYTGTFRRSTLR
jgi:acetyl-CoA carboxylase alpha subunit